MKKLLILALSICTIGLTGCTKNEITELDIDSIKEKLANYENVVIINESSYEFEYKGDGTKISGKYSEKTTTIISDNCIHSTYELERTEKHNGDKLDDVKQYYEYFYDYNGGLYYEYNSITDSYDTFDINSWFSFETTYDMSNNFKFINKFYENEFTNFIENEDEFSKTVYEIYSTSKYDIVYNCVAYRSDEAPIVYSLNDSVYTDIDRENVTTISYTFKDSDIKIPVIK